MKRTFQDFQAFLFIHFDILVQLLSVILQYYVSRIEQRFKWEGLFCIYENDKYLPGIPQKCPRMRGWLFYGTIFILSMSSLISFFKVMKNKKKTRIKLKLTFGSLKKLLKIFDLLSSCSEQPEAFSSTHSRFNKI